MFGGSPHPTGGVTQPLLSFAAAGVTRLYSIRTLRSAGHSTSFQPRASAQQSGPPPHPFLLSQRRIEQAHQTDLQGALSLSLAWLPKPVRIPLCATLSEGMAAVGLFCYHFISDCAAAKGTVSIFPCKRLMRAFYCLRRILIPLPTSPLRFYENTSFTPAYWLCPIRPLSFPLPVSGVPLTPSARLPNPGACRGGSHAAALHQDASLRKVTGVMSAACQCSTVRDHTPPVSVSLG